MKKMQVGISSNISIGATILLVAASAGAMAQDQAAIEAGEQVYEEHCQQCHGEKLRSAGAMPDLRNLGPGDREKFLTIVQDGRNQMPAWQGIISPQEIDQIWAYIRSRSR